MTETAVVTNFSVSDMWDMLPTYTKNANALGSTIADVYNAATLYYQQGLTTSQSMALANETLKMARIGGIEAAEATDMMTAALRGFNMEINQGSAQKINDVYSKLAAITAADTKEIGSAMERTASIASSANMDFETTSAFLSQMIETTREAPENLGTAMKTIIARFQELKVDPKSLVDSEGEALDFNRVDKALKSVETESNELVKAANKLTSSGKDGVFADEKGFNMDAAYDAVGKFVSEYNDTLKSLSGTGDASVRGSGNRMKQMTDIMKNSLSKVGISIGEDGRLSVSEENFKNADYRKLKSVFGGKNSYADIISGYASGIGSSARNAENRSAGGVYGSNGAYNSYYGGMYYNGYV